MAELVAAAVVDPDLEVVKVPVVLPAEVADARAGGGAVGRLAVGGGKGGEGEDRENEGGEAGEVHFDDGI